MRCSRSSLFLAALVCSPFVAAEPKDWEGEAELGVLITSGNTDQTTINGRLGFKHEVEYWRNSATFRSLYSKADGTTDSEKYAAEAETNYKFAEPQFLFFRGAYEDDRFSNYDYRSNVTAGYGSRVWEPDERTFLDLSVGAGYRYNRFDEPNEDNEQYEEQAIGRLAGQLDYALSPTALFRQKLSTEIGLEDGNTVTQSLTSVQAQLRDNLSLKISYLVENISDAPPGDEDTNSETTISVLYGF